ncbi:hypothetical protein HanIR_Chr13g0646771 [Helianthus annuus]|nr:hypothetical protein HanIR_Chr13g0646771 [Helianthus annuus]
MYTKPHIPAVIEDYKDLILVIITLKTSRVLGKQFDKKRMTHIADLNGQSSAY